MKIGIIGLGYVGLPLVIQFAKSGAQVLGIDVDETKVNALNAGESYIKHIPAAEVRVQRDAGQIEATTDYARVKELDAVPPTRPAWAGKIGFGGAFGVSVI